MRSPTRKKRFTLSLLACIILSPAAHAIGLKENSIITDNTIKLGDVFYDLKRDEDRVLGAAPRPGQDMTLNARTLLRIAIAMDLPWRPSNNGDYVTLRREATLIEYDQIKETLHSALYDEGISGDYEITIPSQYHTIALPADQPANLSITRFSVDSKRKNFEATLAAPSAKNPIQQITVKGQLSPMITIPVLTRNIQHGRVITEQDLKYLKIKERDFSRDTIADAEYLVGMTAKRLLIADRPVRSSEVEAPQAVERGDIVTLSLDGDLMNLTTKVKALQNGAKGDIIRVVNTGSNKTIQARVTGQNTVTVAN